MLLLLISALAGFLSVLAPCVIVLIPVLIARSSDGQRERSPFFVIAGLSVSIFIFSLALKASTLLLDVPTSTWQLISGLIIVLFGLTYIFPQLWEKISGTLKLQENANKNSGKALHQKGVVGDILLGASLGPVFGACSPTYALIIASILPVSPVQGLIYLLAFVAGLAIALSIIAVGGNKAVQKLGWGINPKGWFKRSIGILFLIVGITIAGGYDKKILSYAVENGLFNWQVNLESKLQQ